MYVLIECLIGFRKLFKEAGIFLISRNMIGLNCQGEIRVWLNENFATNSPVEIASVLDTLDQ